MSEAAIRYTGPLTAETSAALCSRSLSATADKERDVAALVADVRARGDLALRELAAKFDGVHLAELEVPRERFHDALLRIAPELRQALERACRNLETFARASLPRPLEVEVEPGVRVGRRADALGRVGIYAPGGTASYPSSVLMGVVPARVAGVAEILVCTPPSRSGQPADVVLAAAAIGGAHRVFLLGGAGAIAALAYGTESVPRVDLIAGPGNAWVAEAKRQVSADVAIDAPAGPSEILILADASADPIFIAGEALAQAEHDVDACVVVVCVACDPAPFAAAIASALQRQPRKEIIRQALASRGGVLRVETLDQAIAFANAFAAEHLLLALVGARALLPRLRNAGTIMLGAGGSIAFADYLTGANHVLPTAGSAARRSGLSVSDFLRWQTYQEISGNGAARLAGDAERLARSEGLPAHAEAAAAHAGHSGNLSPKQPRLRETLSSLSLYKPTRPKTDIGLTDNTSLWGAAPGVTRVLSDIPSDAVTRYPTPYSDALVAALAEKLGVHADNVVTGCGSDDLLDAAIAAFCDPGDVLTYRPPTFGMISSLARKNGVVAEPVSDLRRSKARLIYLCAPNNPTGEDIALEYLDSLPAEAIVVLDEAYIEYSSRDTAAALAARSDRLIVMRTLSKAYGLAGLRIGYAVGSARLVGEIAKCRGPYKVGGVAELAALSALGDEAWVQARVAATLVSRSQFIHALRDAGFAPLPTEANFVLVPVKRSSEAIAAQMRERGVAVRAFSDLHGIGEALRISIGPEAMMQSCLAALLDVRG